MGITQCNWRRMSVSTKPTNSDVNDYDDEQEEEDQRQYSSSGKKISPPSPAK